ncbi:hypothetical protein ACJ41O_012160 [Fusarium nematophilum]
MSCRWSDPMYFDFDGIDPSLFFDDDGKAYVQVCAHPRGGIWQFEIDIRTAQLVTAPHLLWEGWDCRFTEGPHVYKKDDYYYLLVAEGGTFEDHMISIARSKSIDGPFEPCPSNPLLTSGGTRNYLHHTGHGDFFQDPSGDWWTVLLAVRRTGNHYPLGRETFLTRVDWPGYGWPTIHDPSSCNIAATQAANLLRRNGFVHLRDADPSKYKIYDRVVSILASAADLSSHKDTLSFAGRRQIHLEGSSSVVLRTPPDIPSGSLRSGICVYKDEHRFAALGLDFGRGIVYFEARNKASGYSATASMTVLRRERIGLCISYTGLEWTFLYRMDGEDWVKMGVVDTMRLSGRDFIGPIVGMFAVGLGNLPLPMDESQFAALGYDVPVPPTDSAFQETSPPCENPQSLVAQMIRLNLLLYDIILLNARVVAEQAQGAIYRELDRGLVHALDGWVNNLSLQLRYSEENVGYWVEAGLGTMFVIMHINYNHAGQLLFYQHLHSAQDLEQEALGAKTARIFAQRCKQHATNLCDLIYRANQQPETEVLYPLAGHILSLASTVQIHTLLFGVDDGEILAAKTRLERNFEMISSLNNFWPMTHKSIQRLQHFHNACLRSQDDSFRLDTWMLRFLLGFTKDMEDRAGDWPHEQPSKEFDHLRNLLDI